MNNEGKVKHTFESLESMLGVDPECREGPAPCLLHPNGRGTSCRPAPNAEIHLGISGSPCQPYSQKRGAKRWANGGVGNHNQCSTMDYVLSWYVKYEPHIGVTEQVKGFEMRSSSDVEESPMQRSLVGIPKFIFIFIFKFLFEE